MRKIFAIRKLHSAIEEGKQTFAEYTGLVEALETVNLMLHNVALDTVLYSDIPVPTVGVEKPVRQKRTAESTPRKQYVKVEPDVIRPILGTLPDKEIASTLGCSVGTVVRYRKKWDIPPYNKSRNRSNKQWSSDHESMLGCDTDENIAQILNRTVAAVLQRRCKLGIPSYEKSMVVLDDNAHLFVTFSNAEVAGLLGVPKKVVDAAHNDKKTIDDALNIKSGS